MLVFVLCLVHNVACVSVLSISDCNEELIRVFVLCLLHNVACVLCVSGIDFTGFYNFSITFWSCSDGVVFYVLYCLC
jgi:hypothetical protein